MIQVDELYVLARKVLLDAITALGSHRDAIVLVGAQAVYLRVGEADLAVAPFTTDGDLAIDPAVLAEIPPLENALRAAGFFPKTKDSVGIWIATHPTRDSGDVEVGVDLSAAGSALRWPFAPLECSPIRAKLRRRARLSSPISSRPSSNRASRPPMRRRRSLSGAETNSSQRARRAEDCSASMVLRVAATDCPACSTVPACPSRRFLQRHPRSGRRRSGPSFDHRDTCRIRLWTWTSWSPWRVEASFVIVTCKLRHRRGGEGRGRACRRESGVRVESAARGRRRRRPAGSVRGSPRAHRASAGRGRDRRRRERGRCGARAARGTPQRRP
jgi:hypothetical protein